MPARVTPAVFSFGGFDSDYKSKVGGVDACKGVVISAPMMSNIVPKKKARAVGILKIGAAGKKTILAGAISGDAVKMAFYSAEPSSCGFLYID